MNPINEFESAAYKVWAAEIPANKKAAQLSHLAGKIRTYSVRLVKSARAKKLDPWRAQFVDRAHSYLDRLAVDVDSLATSCIRSKSA